MQRQQFIQHFILYRNKLLTRHLDTIHYYNDATNKKAFLNVTTPYRIIPLVFGPFGRFRMHSVPARSVLTPLWASINLWLSAQSTDHLAQSERGHHRSVTEGTDHVLICDLVWRRGMASLVVFGCGFAKWEPATTRWSVAITWRQRKCIGHVASKLSSVWSVKIILYCMSGAQITNSCILNFTYVSLW
jgi:hypothetical protein